MFGNNDVFRFVQKARDVHLPSAFDHLQIAKDLLSLHCASTSSKTRREHDGDQN